MISFLWFNIVKMAKDWPRSLIILAFLALWFDFVRDVASDYSFNMTESVDGKIFKMRPDLTVSKETTVMFEWNDPVLPKGVKHMTKHVLCFPGDVLKREGLAFYCNGVIISRAKQHTRTGDPLKAFDWTEGKVPNGVFFAGTDHPDGYDSRYYGFVPLDSAVVVERAL
jgi:type IV secretory pathway protease TraF